LRFLTLLGVVLALSGCGKNLRPDEIVPSTRAKYLSAEFSACGRMWNGVGSCSVVEGRDLNSVDLKIQGYYRGTVKFSTTCEFDSDLPLSVRYSGSQIIGLFIPGPASHICGVSFVVSPEYPNEQKQRLTINSFKGHLLIEVNKEGVSWIGHYTKVKAGAGPTDVFKIPLDTADPKVEVSFRSERCGVSKDLELDVNESSVTVPLRELIPTVQIRTCVIEGVVFTTKDDIRLSWIVVGYDPKFIPLPVPEIKFEKEKIKIVADDNVSVISVDNLYDIDRESEFDFDQSKPHVVRTLTVGGRLALGIWVPGKGFTWIL
jgi:hypothetical protein